jgi:NADPH-dependent curcumin reductase CurA
MRPIIEADLRSQYERGESTLRIGWAAEGLIDDNTFTLETNPVPEIGEGEALVKVKWISIDPTNRTWIGEEPTYLPPVQIGETMRALGLGEVVASNGNYPVGSLVAGLTGWSDYTVASDSTR